MHINKNRNFYNQIYYDELAKIIVKHISFESQKLNVANNQIRVLDVGCGFGEILKELNKYKFKTLGIDINQECLNSSRKFSDVKLLSVYDLDEITEKFDYVVCSHVLEHCDNPIHAIKNLLKVSKKKVIIAVPNLARLANFGIRNPRIINDEHNFGWDCHHLKTLLVKKFNIDKIKFIQDGVTIPFLRNRFFYNFLVKSIEYKILPKIMPFQSNSLIIEIDKNEK